ncbi:MAG: hypothetical protein REI94_10850 [Moraxellaceae bacterium]|nr:hypothetical protein [Moraxellaceae bacterium]
MSSLLSSLIPRRHAPQPAPSAADDLAFRALMASGVSGVDDVSFASFARELQRLRQASAAAVQPR